ncbi:MAG: Crp/Fnr family transcriptional regulator, partial [Acidobacteria bacterium]|nr:Crp/Fnr family transcriptional regulator [Acidobacteriota bacterium]
MALPDAVFPAKLNVVGPSGLPTRTDREGRAVTHGMLLAMQEDEFRKLRPLLEPLTLTRYQLLYEQSGKIEFAYFPNEGMVSLVFVASDGRSVEVGICGRDGVVGVPLAFGFDDAPTRAIVQVPGNGFRVPSALFIETLEECPSLRRLIERYIFTQQLQVAQTAVCNRLHDMAQRLARWLLMCQDTVDSGLLPLTHEFLAQMLGSGRPTVTIAAGVLERAGLIESTRGSVKIVNRKRL